MPDFKETIDLLIDTNKKLVAGEISVEKAKQVAVNTQVIINGAKVLLEYMRLYKEDNPFFKTESHIINIYFFCFNIFTYKFKFSIKFSGVWMLILSKISINIVFILSCFFIL